MTTFLLKLHQKLRNLLQEIGVWLTVWHCQDRTWGPFFLDCSLYVRGVFIWSIHGIWRGTLQPKTRYLAMLMSTHILLPGSSKLKRLAVHVLSVATIFVCVKIIHSDCFSSWNYGGFVGFDFGKNAPLLILMFQKSCIIFKWNIDVIMIYWCSINRKSQKCSQMKYNSWIPDSRFRCFWFRELQ